MKTINALFASAVERFPGRTALLEPTDDARIVSYTYAELQQKVYAFTGYLQEQHFIKGQQLIAHSRTRLSTRKRRTRYIVSLQRKILCCTW